MRRTLVVSGGGSCDSGGRRSRIRRVERLDDDLEPAMSEDALSFHFARHHLDHFERTGVEVPIIPGIMPIVGFTKLARFSDACGAEIPRWMRKKFESYGDDADSIRAFGLDIVTELCERLLKGGAPGLHFYSMNQSALTTEICRRLG